VILADLKAIQELENGILWKFTINGETNHTIYWLFFPILYIIGDTMEHNKLVSLKNGPTSPLPCCFCDVKHDDLDDLSIPTTLQNGQQYKELMQTSNGRKILNNLGYHVCKHNVLYDMEYCDPGGVNLAVLPQNLHAFLL